MKPTVLSPSDITEALAALNAMGTGWNVEDGKLTKTFIFKDFIEAFGFMTQIALSAEKMNHHPEWHNVYSRVSVQLVTHSESAITDLDIALAEKMEQTANRIH